MRDEPLARRQLRLDGGLHGGAARTDLGDALVAAHPLHGVAQGLLKRRVTSRTITLGAVVQNLVVAKAVERARRQRRVALVLGAVALGLDDEHRGPRTTKGAHVGQPVGERLVAKCEAAMGVELLRLRLWASTPAGKSRGTSETAHACRDRYPARRNPISSASPAYRMLCGASGTELTWMPWVDGTASSKLSPRNRRQICVLPTRPLPRIMSLTVTHGCVVAGEICKMCSQAVEATVVD